MQALVSDGKQLHCSVFRVQIKSALETQIGAQRSGSNLERRSDEVSEL